MRMVVPEKQWLSTEVFNLMQHSMPVCCVDLIPLRKTIQMKWEVLLVKRKIYPEIGKWCAIGGRVLKGEHFKTAITRQAKRELGVTVSVLSPWSPDKPVWIYNDPKADPQKHIIALVYPVIIKHGEIHSSGPEFSRAKWFPITRLPKDMGFGHDREIKAVEQALQML